MKTIRADPRRAVKLLLRIIRKEKVSPRAARSALADLYANGDGADALPLHGESVVLDAFVTLSEAGGLVPALYEIAAEAGLAQSTVSDKMHRLEMKGYLTRLVKGPQRARNYKLTDLAHNYLAGRN